MQLFHDHLMEEGLSESNPVGRPFSRPDDGAGIGTDNASMPKRSSPPTGSSGRQEAASTTTVVDATSPCPLDIDQGVSANSWAKMAFCGHGTRSGVISDDLWEVLAEVMPTSCHAVVGRGTTTA